MSFVDRLNSHRNKLVVRLAGDRVAMLASRQLVDTWPDGLSLCVDQRIMAVAISHAESIWKRYMAR